MNGAGTIRPGASWEELAGFPATSAPEGLQSTTLDLAYILYTSGSTGRPKGVMLSHQNALTFVDWCAETFQIKPEDRLSNHAPLHFDLSFFDVYNAVEAGPTGYMVPDEPSLVSATLAKFLG